MSEIHADGGPLPFIPDDVTIAQFILNEQHPTRPVQTGTRPWLIEEVTGRKISSDEVSSRCVKESSSQRRQQIRTRVFGLTNALKIRWNIGKLLDILLAI